MFENAAPGAALDEPSQSQQGPVEKRARRLAEDWSPSKADYAYASNMRYRPQEIAVIVERFKNHWLSTSGAKACKVDWSRTWRNWCLNEDRKKVAEAAKYYRADPNQVDDAEWSRRLLHWTTDGYWSRNWGPTPHERGLQVEKGMMA